LAAAAVAVVAVVVGPFGYRNLDGPVGNLRNSLLIVQNPLFK
jgi:hypothetical protein